jgi:Putative 2/3 transmembrane domain holin
MPRMLLWAVLTVILIAAAFALQEAFPGSVLAVTFYKAHLMALGGWGGYWLDRALFPYARPHTALDAAAQCTDDERANVDFIIEGLCGMLRRAIVVAACLVCVGLGA